MDGGGWGGTLIGRVLRAWILGVGERETVKNLEVVVAMLDRPAGQGDVEPEVVLRWGSIRKRRGQGARTGPGVHISSLMSTWVEIVAR